MPPADPDPTLPPFPPPTPGSTLAREVSAAGAASASGAGGSHDPDRVPWGRALPGGTRVGDYTIQAPLAAGGMGVVYLAQQAQPHRTVALKLVRPGLATARMLRRFELEAETLGRLQHPGIAQIYEAGTFDLGEGPQPFFAMEFVVGVPLTQYAKQKSLGTRERMELAAKIADAVQHAHQRGVVHRDLKPSNILVTDEGQPKILDFGVARLTDSDTASTTLNTDIGQLVGTLPYMSPEQASGDPAQIDTRSDVYALGVVIYELLVDRLPHDIGKKMMVEAARIIREDEPTKLSSINTSLRGDVETIVGHALEKDKERRYQSASALAADIRRYLMDEPISARPAGTWYQVVKFSKRNKGFVAGVVSSMFILLAGLIVSLYAFGIARRSEQRAQRNEQKALEQAAIAEAVAKFQTDMLAMADPDKMLGAKVTIVQAMQAAVKTLDAGSLKDQPLVEASVRNTIGTTLRALSQFDEAEPSLRRALAIRRAALPAGHPDIAGSLNNLALLLETQNKPAEAEPLYRESLAIWRAALPAGHPQLAKVLNNLALLLWHQNKLAEAEELCREALELNRATLPAGHRNIATSLNGLALLLQEQNKLAEAEPLFREALQIKRSALPVGHPDIAPGLDSLAGLLQDQNKLAEAETLFREALEIRRAALPAGHPEIAVSLNNLALLLQAQNKLAEAQPLLREALEIYRAALPVRHPKIATVLNNLASLLQAQNKLGEAEPLFREALQIKRSALPVGHPSIAAGLINLARVQQGLGQTAEARAGWDEALAMLRQGSPQGSALLARVLWRSGSARLDNNDPAAALPELEEAVSLAEKFLPPDHPHLKEYRDTLAKCRATLEELNK